MQKLGIEQVLINLLAFQIFANKFAFIKKTRIASPDAAGQIQHQRHQKNSNEMQFFLRVS